MIKIIVIFAGKFNRNCNNIKMRLSFQRDFVIEIPIHT